MDVSHRTSDRHVRRPPHVGGARVCDTSHGSTRRVGDPNLGYWCALKEWEAQIRPLVIEKLGVVAKSPPGLAHNTLG